MGKVFIHDQTGEMSAVKTSNAKLIVNCPSGSAVTITSGQNEYVGVSDTTDKVVFYGLTQGIWNVVVNDGTQIYEQSIDITTDYEFTLDFFSATINIRYPYGSICTCSNGSTIYTAPDTSGIWSCNIPCADTWTLEITNGKLSKTEDVEITYDGQEVSVALEYFTATINVFYPNGAVCSCSNEGNIYSASDTNGSWSFAVHETGPWIIKATDNIQTVTEVVYITTDGQVESVTIKFFASTIDITYPVGATCVCSDGITNFTAPDNSGRWILTVPRIGIWRVEATKDGNIDIENVEIVESGQSVSVTCEFFISYINVVYPVETFKVVLWYIDSYGTKVEKNIDTSASGACRFTVTQAGEYEINAYRVAPYVGIEETAGDYTSGKVTISASGETKSLTLTYNTIPEFTYTGSYKIVDDSGGIISETSGNWNIIFLTSGLFKSTVLNGAKNGIDIFVLGGGGNGGNTYNEAAGGYMFASGGGGGGGGYREVSYGAKINVNSAYEIEIGGAGGSSSAFGVSASAGEKGGDASNSNNENGPGAGGRGSNSGGKGGLNAASPYNGEDGTYPFDMTSGTRYGPGGAGGYGYNGKVGLSGSMAYGGKDGGGDSNTNATPNSGGGGGGAVYDKYGSHGPASGGSGIVIIRNKR